jgi:hypothetical protein
MKFTSEMMKRVHEIAATMEGDYIARLSLAFREVMKEEELEGTEKQVAWAKDIKSRMLAELSEAIEQVHAFMINRRIKKGMTLEEAEQKSADKNYLESLNKHNIPMFEKISNEKSAKWFIENRNEYFAQMYANID